MTQTVPPTGQALFYEAKDKMLHLETMKTPEAIPGSVVVRVLSASIQANTEDILQGKVPFMQPPERFIPGARGVARVVAVGSDATSLEPGQLVMTEPYARGRDDPNQQVLLTATKGFSPGGERLFMTWRDGNFAEYCRMPLENVYALNEEVLCGSPSDGGFGYSFDELTILPLHLIAYGGLRSVNAQPGETVIVAPATGQCSGTAVEVALAMGCKVIALGRSMEKMAPLKKAFPAVNLVTFSGNREEDLAKLAKFGKIDVYYDMYPPAMKDPEPIRTCISSLRSYGRAAIMGIPSVDLPVPFFELVVKNITIRGMWMYERNDVYAFLKLVESGNLKLGKAAGHEVKATFKMPEWQTALQETKKYLGRGELVCLNP